MKKRTPPSPTTDANLFAARLAKSLKSPVNLGIGTLPGHNYQPIDAQTYQAGRSFLLDFLGLKDQNLSLIPVKGGGSGAISAGISALFAMGYRPKSLSFSGWDWTGYDSFCYTFGLTKIYLLSPEYSSIDENTLLMIQTNRNGDGTRLDEQQAKKIIAENNQLARPNFVDLPYFSGDVQEKAVLKLFQETAQTPTIIAFSPTKIFQTFAARPGGVVLVLFPNEKMFADHRWVHSITARGTTGFDDAVTRELWQEMAYHPEILKNRQAHYLRLISTATKAWSLQAPAKAKVYFDTTKYGGMFRLFPAQADTQACLAEKNIVAVHMKHNDKHRIRVNLSGVVSPNGELIPEAETVIKTFFKVLNLS